MNIYMVFEKHWHDIDGGTETFMTAFHEKRDAEIRRNELMEQYSYNTEVSSLYYEVVCVEVF